jgi:hypothetical protein
MPEGNVVTFDISLNLKKEKMRHILQRRIDTVQVCLSTSLG